VIKDNCIGFEGIGIGDFTNINIPPNQLKVAYEYIISKYPDVKDVLLTIANTIINNNYGPNGTIIILCYYLKYLEDKGINTSNLINEFKKQKHNPEYLLSSLSVPKIGCYLANQDIDFEFPKKSKKVKGQPSPDIIIHQKGNDLKVDIKGRGAVQLKKLAYELKSMIENPNQPIKLYSFDEGIETELIHSELRRIIKKAFLKQKVDIVIIDETNNLFQIGGVFMLKGMGGNTDEETFKLVKNNIVFCSNFNGVFKCFEINKDIFFKDSLPQKIKEKVPEKCENCNGNKLNYWKEEKDKVIFRCSECGNLFIIISKIHNFKDACENALIYEGG